VYGMVWYNSILHVYGMVWCGVIWHTVEFD